MIGYDYGTWSSSVPIYGAGSMAGWTYVNGAWKPPVATGAGATGGAPGTVGSPTTTAAGTPATTTGLIGGLPTLPTPADLGTAEAAYTTNALNSYAGMPVIKSWLSGSLSPETAANVARVAAESAGGSGMAGAPLTMTDLMRILGTTTEAQQQKGLTGLNQAYGVFPQYSPLGLPSLASQNWQAGLGAATKGQELTAEMALAQQKLAAQMQAQQAAQELAWQKLNQTTASNAAYTSALNSYLQALKGTTGAVTAPAQVGGGWA